MIKWDLFQGCKDDSIFTNKTMIHHVNKMKDGNHMFISIDAENHLTNSTSIYDKNAQQNGVRGNIPQYNKRHI